MEGGVLKCQAVSITNRLGLHARAAGQVVNLAGRFDAIVTFEKEGQTASAASVMELMMLTAAQGDRVIVKTSGPEADAALEAVASLIRNGFGERQDGGPKIEVAS